MKKKIVTIGGTAIAILIVFMLILNGCRAKKQNITFETAKVTKGKITSTVTATGTLEAIKTVAVGTQVSGVISKLYVDFNSHVKKGQLLAEIDKVPLLASLESAQASLDAANAEVTYQTANYNRIKALYDKKLAAQSDYEQALYNYSNALASMKTAKSGYDRAKINLDYATIYSPIDGVVLNRAVDEGQTVAASFNTPTLFSIANDLTQMEVQANIDEADIGQVKDGQKVEFTVDAFPDLKFNGEVTEIRLQPVVTSNVVTYTVIVKAPNPDYKLMPGMTANITVYVDEADNALTVPSKALHFVPDQDLLKAYYKSLPDSLRPKNELAQSGKKTMWKVSTGSDSTAPKENEVWVKNGSIVRPVKIDVGINDGITAEIKSGLKEGDEVILSMSAASEKSTARASAASSPFMPKRPSKK
jgi:HlyD family secretion protein